MEQLPVKIKKTTFEGVGNMLEFLLGAGIATSVFGGMALGLYQRDKKVAPTQTKTKHPVLKELYDFFHDVEKGNNLKTTSAWSGLNIENEHVSVYVFTEEKGIKRFLIYVKYSRVFDIKYDIHTKTFIRFEDEDRILKADEIETFANFFHQFVEHILLQKPNQDIVSMLNQTTTEKSISAADNQPKEWKDYLSNITQERVLVLLQELLELIHKVHLIKEDLDTEETHRLERLENEVLPEVLHAFCLFDEKEQQRYEHVLLATLSNTKETLLELQQKERKKKEFSFQKNIELLKNI